MTATAWSWGELDRFEADARRRPSADLADYLPPADHPQHLDALTELVRLDRELAAGRGVRRTPESYFARFPLLAANSIAAAAVRSDDGPQTMAVADAATPFTVLGPLALLAADLPSFTSAALDTDTPPTTPLPSAELRAGVPARRQALKVPLSALTDTELIQPPPAWPAVGESVAGFRLTGELGKGAFGRVYLAKQGDLAGRQVALKLGTALVGESHTLARLQHTNIVPIYSAHTHGRMQVVCMPFLGRTTLAHLIGCIRAGGPSVPESVRHLLSTFDPHADLTRHKEHPEQPSCRAATLDALAPPDAPPGGGLWDRLSGGPLADAAAWAVAELAQGLAHAHARGILHRDIKPANVLVTDDGTPMLLDFNLADDANAENGLKSAAVGGTLPYMAPEQMVGFHRYSAGIKTDARSDLYGLGVVLYELLAGARPFPERQGTVSEMITAMTTDRSALPPPVRSMNRFVRPSLCALVSKLLDPDPEKRYQTAEQLADDLHRYLARRPLKYAPNPSVKERVRNWAHRHPKLTSSGTVGVLCGAVLLASVGGGLALREHALSLEARIAFDQHARDLSGTQALLDDRGLSRPQLDSALARCESILAKYALKADADTTPAEWEKHALVKYLPAADRAKLREQVGEFYFLLGRAAYQRAKMADLPGARTAAVADAERWNRQAEAFGGAALVRAVGEQRADLARIAGRTADADRQAAASAELSPGSARDRFLLGFWWYQRGALRKALPELAAATADDPANFSAWFVRGSAHRLANEHDLAAMAFTACVALRPDFAPAHLNRGLALVAMNRPHLAVEDFDAAIKLDPTAAEPRFLRAGALAQLGQHKDAEQGYTDALACNDCPPRVLLYRAAVRDALKDDAGAKADRTEADKREPTDCLGWVARAENAAAADPTLSLKYAEKALELAPLDAVALQLKAHLLSEKLNRAADAVAVLDKALEHYPEHVQCLGGRAVLKARGGDRDGAHADATAAVRLLADGPTLYQAGCVYALTAKGTAADRFKAVELLAAAAKAGFGREHWPADPDLDPIRTSDEFKELLRQHPDKKQE